MSDDDLDLSAVAADAALLDALAAGVPGAADDALAGLGALRTALDEDLRLDSTRAPMQAAPVGEVVALRRPSGRRTGGRAAVLVAGAALALSSTGVAAATYEARPGDAFYGLRTAVAGPRAEDPQLLRERLDAVQQRLRSADAAERDAAREELDEVASLLSELEPGQRGGLDRRHAALTEQLAASETTPEAAREEPTRPTSPAEPPAGPRTPVGPPAGTPGAGRTPDSRPTATRGPQAPPPAKPTAKPAPPSPEPQPNGPKATPKPRPTATPTEQPGRPSPRASQGADRPDDGAAAEGGTATSGPARPQRGRSQERRSSAPAEPWTAEPSTADDEEPASSG